MEDKERKILEIVKKKHKDTGGHNGNGLGDFDHILKMSIPERNQFLQNMVDRKLIVFREGANTKMVMMPK